MYKKTTEFIGLPLVTDNPSRLTTLQNALFLSRIKKETVIAMEQYGYEKEDLNNVKFDPLKNLNKLPDVYEAGGYIAEAIKNKKRIFKESVLQALFFCLKNMKLFILFV